MHTTECEKLTVCKAEHPQSRDGQLGQVILFSGPIVRRIVHFLLGVQPLVSEYRDEHNEKRNRGGQGCQHPQARQYRFQGTHSIGIPGRRSGGGSGIPRHTPLHFNLTRVRSHLTRSSFDFGLQGLYLKHVAD